MMTIICGYLLVTYSMGGKFAAVVAQPFHDDHIRALQFCQRAQRLMPPSWQLTTRDGLPCSSIPLMSSSDRMLGDMMVIFII